jgi:acyl carrier protein
MVIDSLNLIRDAFSDLADGGILEMKIEVTPATVLLGAGTPLDSLGFVSVMTEIEDRLAAAAGREVLLLFDEIHAFNPDRSTLTVGTLSRFIDRLVAGA